MKKIFLLLLAAAGGPTWGLEGSELPRAPHVRGTFRNLEPGFWSASNWTRVRFYLLGASTLVRPDRGFAPLPSAVPDVDALRRNHQAATVTWVGPTGQRVTLAQDLSGGRARLATGELPAGGSFEVILSDGLNSSRQSVRR